MRRRQRTAEALFPEQRGEGHPDWEYVPVRIPADVTKLSAAVQLSLHAEGGWELARTLRYGDGTRRVLMRRKRRPVAPGAVPEPPWLPHLFR